jgi:acetylornithine deacetylase/succinyl-diaminopimelate desuccinylase-like protein
VLETPVDEALEYVKARRTEILGDLKTFLRFPTVGTEARHSEDMQRCAEWLAAHLRQIGLSHVGIHPTAGHPIVHAQSASVARRRTVLIYGHYDVQPADPLEEWTTPPFVPVIRDGSLSARGATDDKGQLFLHVKAIEALLRTRGELPVNVHLVFEGEEESGSLNLTPFLTQYFQGRRIDAAVVSDMSILGPDRPALTYGMRGALSAEIEIYGPRMDLHSGVFGGAVHNPVQALCEIVSKLHDNTGRVTIPGFYDRVLPLTHAERQYMAAWNPADKEILRDAGVSQGWGEPGYTAYERIAARPSISISGIAGGYSDAGVEAIIPARSKAKIGFRLAPHQDPEEIFVLLRAFLRKVTPSTVAFRLRKHFTARPALVDVNHPVIRAAARAYQTAFRVAPVLLRSGGTIPVVSTLQELFAAPVVLMGFALPDANLHGPNEKLHLQTFFRGIHTSLAFLQYCSEIPS